ncbi:hypothetical protein O0L34_g18894 [Tuta absoluta]|nr:hypothetical protein O0L34_g18894 [Tuta absoluta]
MSSGNKLARRNILKLWHFEDQLKELYGTYVEALTKFAQDSVEANREKAVSAMSYLLMHHPEREKMLLTNIINKLGDPSTSVASKVIYHLCQLLYNHPNMKSVVLAEIEKMLFRTNIAPRAQYYGICFLNQFFLGKDDSRVAENLIRIYFSFFKASIKKGAIDTRLMSAILTGVKRAYPFADKERLAHTPAHIDSIHKLVHLAPLTTSIHALALLFQISSASKHTDDRYYTSLYRKLTSPDIFNTTHSALLFSLIFKSLKQDKDVARVSSFIKRLLQLCVGSSPGQAAGLLLIISRLLKCADNKRANLIAWTPVKQELKEEIDVSEKTEVSTEREENSESKAEENGAPDVTEAVKQELKKTDLLRGDKIDLLMDDEEESYVDLHVDDQGNVKPRRRARARAVTGWYHAKVNGGHQEEVDDKDEKDKELESKIKLKKTINMDRAVTGYDAVARNPSFAGAEHSAYLELTSLVHHFHPTVQLFAEKLLNADLLALEDPELPPAELTIVSPPDCECRRQLLADWSITD